jgi:hypothetical protein
VSPPVLPPLDHALVKAVACALVAETKQPLSRQSLAEVTARAPTALDKPLRRSPGGRMLATAAPQPWRDQHWIFPRHPHCAAQAEAIVAWRAGTWPGKPLGPKDHRRSADAKTSIQARHCPPALPPAPGRPAPIEHASERGGAWQYLAAWDVRRGDVMGQGEPTTGIEPLGRLVHQVLAQEPYRAAERLVWIVDTGSSHRGITAKQQLRQVDSRILVVHTPVHARGLKEVELYCAISQRKVLTPNAFADVEAIRLRLAWYEERSNPRATPFQWPFDRPKLTTLLATIDAHQQRLAAAQLNRSQEAT